VTQPLGIDDFFVIEAGDYLDRLGALAANAMPPGADELVRFSRALRGSALMANQQAIARAAAGLERLLRSYRDGRRSWDGDLTGLVREAIDMLRTLVEQVRSWTPDDTARAERLALQLEGAAGAGIRAASEAAPAASETGVRAFLAREAAALGSVLDQASRVLLGGTGAPETLQVVLRRMQPLRGLAALSDFPPLPDVLDGVERTVVGVSRLELTPSSGGTRLEAAARALARAARDIADRGRPDGEAEEFRSFARLLLTSETEEQPVVAIESLFFDGESGILQRGTPPRSAMAAGMSAAAVVSRGEHLCQAADEISEAMSPTQRDLRLHVLVGDLRTLSAGLPGGLEVAVEAFGVAARAAVARGAAALESGPFAAVIREAGMRLRGFNEVTQPGGLAHAFEQLTTTLDGLATPGRAIPSPLAAVPAPAPVAAPAPVPEPVATAPALDDESDVVPIESLAPDEPEPVPVPLAPQAPQPAAEAAVLASVPAQAIAAGWDLAASYARFEALIVESAAPAPARAEPPAVLAPAAAAPVPSVPPEPAAAVVEIDELCYRGRAALERADLVRREIRVALATRTSTDAIQPLVDELLDLVELALVD
jgi:HPt (histidine-containing phosphotransfer) domain-containing protein